MYKASDLAELKGWDGDDAGFGGGGGPRLSLELGVEEAGTPALEVFVLEDGDGSGVLHSQAAVLLPSVELAGAGDGGPGLTVSISTVSGKEDGFGGGDGQGDLSSSSSSTTALRVDVSIGGMGDDDDDDDDDEDGAGPPSTSSSTTSSPFRGRPDPVSSTGLGTVFRVPRGEDVGPSFGDLLADTDNAADAADALAAAHLAFDVRRVAADVTWVSPDAFTLMIDDARDGQGVEAGEGEPALSTRRGGDADAPIPIRRPGRAGLATFSPSADPPRTAEDILSAAAADA